MQESTSQSPSAQSYYIAMGILFVLVGWMVSGVFNDINQNEEHPPIERYVPTVQTQIFPLLTIDNTLKVFGRTEPDREVRVKTEIAGKVLAIEVTEGQIVNAGQTLLHIDQRDLPERLKQAQLRLKQRIAERKASNNLHQKSYTSDVELAAANALVAEAQAEVKQLELALNDTKVVAPFSGIVQKHFVEVGDYVGIGAELLHVVDLDPLVVRVDISERDIKQVQQGVTAEIKTLNKDTFIGKVRYVGALSQVGTNTFPAEIVIDNPSMAMSAGVSTEVQLQLGTAQAIQVTPAVLAIDEVGNIGVKSVSDNTVQFTPVNVIKSDQDTMWLGGFNADTHIITRGQGFVKAGMEVKEVLEGSPQ